MFTIDQIKNAHSKVKSGADFPNYIQELIVLGIVSYEIFVTDGHAVYSGKDNFNLEAPAKYAPLTIAEKSNAQQFVQDLKKHQQGKTDYKTFCNDSAKNGIVKWIVNTVAMTCVYYDSDENNVLTEKIPG